MAQFSFPFTDGVGGDDGPYSAPFFAGMMSGVFGQDVSGSDASVLLNTGSGTDSLLVEQTTPASNGVVVNIGKALVKGYYYYNDAELTLTINPNTDPSGYDRIDTVVLEIDFVNQTVRAVVEEGTPALSPVPPTLTKNTALYQVPLANIDVPNLFLTITNTEIDNTVRVQAYVWSTEKGGTGYQTYTKGDLLAGGTSGDLVKLPVGTRQSLYSVPSTSTGLAWVTGFYPIVQPTILSSNVSGITISSIPQTFETLLLVTSMQSNYTSSSFENIRVTFNGVGGTSYAYNYFYQYSTTNTGNQVFSTFAAQIFNGASANAAPAGFLPTAVTWIHNYSHTNKITLLNYHVAGAYNTSTSSGLSQTFGNGRFDSTVAVTSIGLTPNGGTLFYAGSSYALYGLGRKAV